MFTAVLEGRFKFHGPVSEETRDLICKLLQLDPAKRPTTSALKQHPFFSGIDWDALYYKKVPPPTDFVREFHAQGGCSCHTIAPEFLAERTNQGSDEWQDESATNLEEAFAGFTFVPSNLNI